MRTTVVPAQITTVEDRIAGNLTFTQIVLLIIPLILGTAIYICIPAKMHVGIFKGILLGLQFALFGGLAIRFRGRILADWLIIYLRFKMRPRRYVFMKNDLTSREVEKALPRKEKVSATLEIKESVKSPQVSISENMKVDRIFENPKVSVSFKLAKKGGLDVALKPVKD